MNEVQRFQQQVRAELDRARRKFPSSRMSMVALTEEVGELAKAMLSESRERVMEEAVQVAVMAMRVAIEGDPSVDEYRAWGGLLPVAEVHEIEDYGGCRGACGFESASCRERV